MKKNQIFHFGSMSRAVLLSIGLLGSTAIVANAASMHELPGLEQPVFVGGLPIA